MINSNDFPLIYILDDHPVIYQSVVESTRSQFNIELFTEVRPFYIALGKYLPDVILLDIGLNHILSGIEILQHLKESHKTSHIPVLIITGLDIDSLKMKLFDDYATEIITKPVKAGFLVSLIKQYTKVVMHKKSLSPILKSSTLDMGYALFVENLENMLERPDIYHLKVTDIAKSMEISNSTFSRLLQKIYGKTPSIFFNDLKLTKAADLVMSNQHSLAQIAEILGFSSDSHLIYSFKKKFNATPRSYYAQNLS